MHFIQQRIASSALSFIIQIFHRQVFPFLAVQKHLDQILREIDRRHHFS